MKATVSQGNTVLCLKLIISFIPAYFCCAMDSNIAYFDFSFSLQCFQGLPIERRPFGRYSRIWDGILSSSIGSMCDLHFSLYFYYSLLLALLQIYFYCLNFWNVLVLYFLWLKLGNLFLLLVICIFLWLQLSMPHHHILRQGRQ